jgi:prophage endopeptidase
LAQKTAAAYKAVLSDQQAQQTRLSELDSRYTKELQNAKREIAGLESDVRTGRSRLRIAATCPGASPYLPEATSTASVDDAGSPRLTHAAELGYFDVRRAWAQAATQIEGLQSYITEICLAQK